MASTRESLTIGKLAKLAGVGVETVRFYERKGLLEQPPRRESGYRQYPPEAVSRLRFIRRSKELGFSLSEIKDLMSLRLDESTACRDIQTRAEAKLAEVQGKIRALQNIEQSLKTLTKACASNTQTGPCPIIDALEPNSRGESESGVQDMGGKTEKQGHNVSSPPAWVR